MKKFLAGFLALLVSTAALGAVGSNLDSVTVGGYLYPKATDIALGSSTKKWAAWLNSINGYSIASLLLPGGGTTTDYLRGDASWQTLNTTAVTEGSNLYYTASRARSAVGATGSGLGYNATNGLFSCILATGSTAGCLSSTDWSTFNSKEIPLIFGTSFARNGSAIACVLATGSTAGCLSSSDWTTFNSKEPAISAGATTQYYRGDKSFQTLNTTAVTEGSNLYYTDARARAAITAGTGISVSSGVVSIADGASTVVSGTDIDWSLQLKKNGPYVKKLTSSTTITFSNVAAGCIQVWVQNTGSFTLTLPATVKLGSGATTFTLTTGSKTDVLTFCSDGTTVILSPVQNFNFN